jgi:hypothetical protein
VRPSFLPLRIVQLVGVEKPKSADIYFADFHVLASIFPEYPISSCRLNLARRKRKRKKFIKFMVMFIKLERHPRRLIHAKTATTCSREPECPGKTIFLLQRILQRHSWHTISRRIQQDEDHHLCGIAIRQV